jgi:hypothetical protein
VMQPFTISLNSSVTVIRYLPRPASFL